MRCGSSSSSNSNRPLSSLLLLGTILSLLLLLSSIIPYCNAEDEVTTTEKDTSSSSSSAADTSTTTEEGSVDHDTTFDHDHDDDEEPPPIKTSTSTNENVEEEEDYDDLLLPDFLIVGAGGGGIQMALYLEKYGYTYKILEKSSNVGNFWTKFPIFDELISVNKYLDDPQQQMRYDWHSLLETPNIKMWQNITEDYFPKGEDWHTYMKLVVKEAGILPHIEYNTEVDMILPSISKEETPCLLLKSGKQQQRCAKYKIFVATGLQEREEPFLRAMGGIRYSEIPNYVSSEYDINVKKPKPDSNYYKHRRVCVLGNGNSGFEVAQNLYKVAGKVVIYGKEPHRLSSVTRYTGDVRTKYLQVLENHNAKLLDDVGHFFWWKKDDQNPKTNGMDRDTKHWTNHYGLTIPQSYQINTMIKILYFIIDFECDTLILTTGFESSVPNGMEMKYTPTESDNIQEQKKSKRKFPKTYDWYESTTNPNVHLLGWLMHERDFRRGAGGFLSGYRYLVRNLFYQIHSDLQGRPYPHYVFTKKQVINHVIKRVQTADDLIILQDGVIIRDAIIKIPPRSPDNDEEEEVVEEYYYYYEGITYNFHNLQNEEEEKEDQDDNNVDVDVGDGDDGSSNNDVVTEDDENGVPNNKEEQQKQKQREEKEEMKKKYEYTPIYLYFTWGDGRDTEAVFEAHIRYDSGRLINRFLHPAIEIGNTGELMRDIHEDLEMEWKLPGYKEAVKRVITNALDGNFDKFKKRTFYPYERKEIPHPPDRPKKQAYNFEVADLRKRRKPGRGEIDFKAKREEIPKLIPTIVESASKYYNDTTHRSDGIAELTARIKQFLPALFEYEDFMNDNDSSSGKQQAAPASPHLHHENAWNDDNAMDFEKEREEEDSYVPAGSCDEVFEEDDEEGTDNSPSLSKSSPTGQDDSSAASSGEGNTLENLQARLAALETKLESVLSDEL